MAPSSSNLSSSQVQLPRLLHCWAALSLMPLATSHDRDPRPDLGGWNAGVYRPRPSAFLESEVKEGKFPQREIGARYLRRGNGC